MAFNLQDSLRSFMQETGGDASPARLRAVLLDDAAGEGRAYRSVIDAAVRVYELGVRTTPAPSWGAIRQQVASEIDDASASSAVNGWLGALGLPGIELPKEATVTPKQPADPAKPQWGRVIAAVVAVGIVVAVLFALVTRDDPSTVTTDPGETTTTASISIATTVGPTTLGPTTRGPTTLGPTTRGPTTLPPTTLPSALSAWVPPTCTALGDPSHPIGSLGRDASAIAEAACDYRATAGVVARVQMFTTDKVLAEYKRWLTSTLVAQNSGGICPSTVTGRLASSESTFSRSGATVGRVLCFVDASVSWIVWYEDGKQFFGTIASSDLTTAFNWWANHGFGSDWSK